MKAAELTCVYFFGEDHVLDECPSNPSLIWVGNSSNAVRQNVTSTPPGYNQPMPPRNVQQSSASSSSSMEALLKEYMAKNDVVIQRQIANALSSRLQGPLSSGTKNLRSQRKEQCKAITLRSGTHLPEVVNDATVEEDNSNFTHKKNSESKNVEAELACVVNKNATSKQPQQFEERPLPPFPQQFQKSKQDLQFKKKFVDVLKQLHINIPLVEALEQMPNYVKFMKDILSKKRRLGEFETVALTKGCTTMLMNKLPPKLKDPGSFTIPCSIGNHYVGKDYVIWMQEARNWEGETHNSNATANWFLLCTYGRVNKFIFPTNFIILECEANKEVPIILVRHFLAIDRTLIDVQKGELTMKVNEQQITFNVLDAMKCVDDNEKCHAIGFIDTIVEPPRPSIDDLSTLELKLFLLHLKYAYLGDTNTFPLTFDQEAKLLEVLKRYKKALGVDNY
ncbi:bromodomain-containing protein [Gossypium australe]|uniref:Bromodomain-containing protein n=1 Tax=Gossypium australe TaxID=47621 RepID=A0A5B6VDF2_9ROSI|nr:bromodomain-containing protein [Gossypium australe]